MSLLERAQAFNLVSIDKEPFFEIYYHEMSSTKIFDLGLLNLICEVRSLGGWLGLRMAKFWNLKRSRIIKKNPE